MWIVALKKFRRNFIKNRQAQRKIKARNKQIKKGNRAVIRSGKKNQKMKPSILIGPTNAAGQAWQWSQVLSASGNLAKSMRVVSDLEEIFEADIKIPRQDFLSWENRLKIATELFSQFNTIFIESMRPLFGLQSDKKNLTTEDFFEDLNLLKKSKIKSAVILHGSDIRDPEMHKQKCEFSPFHHAPIEAETVFQKALENRKLLFELKKKGIPVFITTPDLFQEVDFGTWLPVSINWEKFNDIADKSPAFNHAGPVKVLYLPSKNWIKSAEIIQPILEKLDQAGEIEWIKSPMVNHDQVPNLIAQCDVLIDQFLGIVGVLPCEAMAAGRMVLTHNAIWANSRLPEIPPVIDINPQNLESILRNLKKDDALITKARTYVKRWHDGTESATRLSKALNLK